ncbi:hypothetical protein SPBR_06205 [Sporothrix brasiliensis 5110]|uniref:Major facilitator superfamily (MFS) profile domain-containing protein n=1 Tax=Sporothrix brasiliensis 5110 TaxID=1398154 RepID=A0A0C2IZ08_9PEZI|nr:uncharacterized protein SPBR_06205 [Sporothrix brasiliensis 5110]KIH94351.1 hypothetical protein SPBR_06205 [Sporothrix brasiliensis 5110]
MDDKSSSTAAVHQNKQAIGQNETDRIQQHDGLYQIISAIDEKDAKDRYREEAADNTVGERIQLDDDGTKRPEDNQQTPSLSNSENETLIVAWEENDPENPYNWSKTRKIILLITTMTSIINSTMGSALPSNAVPYMAKEWGVTSSTQMVLPVSTYLVGYILGPLVWAPLSEQYGRRALVLVTFVSS